MKASFPTVVFDVAPWPPCLYAHSGSREASAAEWHDLLFPWWMYQSAVLLPSLPNLLCDTIRTLFYDDKLTATVNRQVSGMKMSACFMLLIPKWYHKQRHTHKADAPYYRPALTENVFDLILGEKPLHPALIDGRKGSKAWLNRFQQYCGSENTFKVLNSVKGDNGIKMELFCIELNK